MSASIKLFFLLRFKNGAHSIQLLQLICNTDKYTKDFDLTAKKIDPTYSERTDQQLDTRPKCNTLDYKKMYIQCDYIVILQHFTDSALVA